MFYTKQNHTKLRRRALALFCSIIMILSFTSSLFVVMATDGDEYFRLTANNHIFVNVGQAIELVDISASVNDVSVNGNNLSWTSANTELSIASGFMKASEKGIFSVVVEDSAGNKSTITVHSKNSTEKEYQIYSEDFSGYANGALPEGWVVVNNKDVTTEEAKKHAKYIDSPSVRDGSFVLGNGLASSAETSVLLPSWLDAYSDYAVDIDFAQNFTFNNMRFGGPLLRVDRAVTGDVTTINNSYIFLARRASSSAGGLEFASSKANGGSIKSAAGSYQNNIGPTQNWDSTVDWPNDSYKMHMKASVNGTAFSMELYRHNNQPHFDGDTARGTDGYLGNVPSPALAGSMGDAWVSKVMAGGVGFKTSGCQLTVDKIDITIPVTMLASNPDYYIPSSEAGSESATFDDLKLGILSDVHIQVGATGGDTNLKTMLTKFKNDGVNVVLATGDLVNTGLPAEYTKFMGIWNSVFTNAATAPKLLAITGNHEFEQAYYGRETVEEALTNYKNAFGYTEINFNEKIKGYHFIGLNSEGAAINGVYSDVSANWLRAQLDAAVAEDRFRPIFVTAHQSLANTTYGSNWGSTNTSKIAEVLKDYPQVVFFAGHSHYPSENERSIYQKDFTAIDVSSLQYTSTEMGGAAPSAFESQGSLSLVVDGASKKMRIDRLRIRGTATATERNPWTFDLPLKKSTFKYTDERKLERQAPTFAANAAIETSKVTVNSLDISFPSASHGDYVQGYNVKIKEKGFDSVVLSKYFVSDFYIDINNMAAKQTTNLAGFLPNTEYTIEVTAIESFGHESTPIVKDFSTLPVTEPSSSYNRADFIDINFATGFEDNSDYRLQHNLYGAANKSKLVESEALGRKVLSAEGWINYTVSSGMLNKVKNSATIELAFMKPEMPTGDEYLFGNPESGGMGININSAGELISEFNIDGSWKSVKTNFEAGKWYHVVASYDGTTIKMYVNGELAADLAAPGTIKHNPDMLFVTVGANSNTSGNAALKYVGEMALARIYTKSLSATEAKNAYAFFKNDPVYQTIYQGIIVLDKLDPDELTADQKVAVTSILNEGNRLLKDATITAEKASDYLSRLNKLISDISIKDPSIKWQTFHDDISSTALMHDKSDQWQVETNPEINKKFITKSDNIDTYITYKVDGYIREFSIESLIYAGFGSAPRDVKVYLSEDGNKWTEYNANYSPEVADPAYDDGGAVAWFNSTLTNKTYIKGTNSYIKIVVKKFESGINWSIGLDDVVIRYSQDATDVDDIPEEKEADIITFVDEFENADKISSSSSNWDVFAKHPETGLSVLSKNNALPGYITYKPVGRKINTLSINLQVAPDFFELERDVKVFIRLANTNKWVQIDVKASNPTLLDMKNNPNKFSTMTLTPVLALPDGVAEVKIELLNDVPWSLMLDRVTMEQQLTKTIDTGKGEENGNGNGKGDKDKPTTGQSNSILFVFAMLVVAILLMVVAHNTVKNKLKRKQNN